MKIYRPTPKDSETVIVIDENMKRQGFFPFALMACSPLFTMFLAAAVFAWGIPSGFIYRKMVSIDQWADQPGNSLLLSYYWLGLLAVSLTAYLLWVFFFRKR